MIRGIAPYSRHWVWCALLLLGCPRATPPPPPAGGDNENWRAAAGGALVGAVALAPLTGCLTPPPPTTAEVLSPNRQAQRVDRAQDVFLWGAVVAGFLAAVAFGAAVYFHLRDLALLALALAGAMVVLGLFAVAFGWALVVGGIALVVAGFLAAIYGAKAGWFTHPADAGAAKLLREDKVDEAVAVLRTRYPGRDRAYERGTSIAVGAATRPPDGGDRARAPVAPDMHIPRDGGAIAGRTPANLKAPPARGNSQRAEDSR